MVPRGEATVGGESGGRGTVPVELPEFGRKLRVDSAALSESLDQLWAN